MGTSVEDGRTRWIVQILLYFNHIWVLVLCAPSSNDVSVLLLNLPTTIMKRTLKTRSIPTGVFSFWVVWSSFNVPRSFNFIRPIVVTETRTFFKSNNFSRHHFLLVIRTPRLLVRRTADIRNKGRPLVYTCTELTLLHSLILRNMKPDTTLIASWNNSCNPFSRVCTQIWQGFWCWFRRKLFNFCKAFYTETKHSRYEEILLSGSRVSFQEFSHGRFESWHF